MPLRAASPSPSPVQSSHRHCLFCNYDITGASIGGNCPECGEPIMRSFERPHDHGIPLPVSCARCGLRLKREPIDGGCAACGYAVLKTMLGPRRCKSSHPTFAPCALMAGLMTIPCWPVLGFGVLIPAIVAIALLIPAYWEYRDAVASRGAFIAAAVGAGIGVAWFVAFFAMPLFVAIR